MGMSEIVIEIIDRFLSMWDTLKNGIYQESPTQFQEIIFEYQNADQALKNLEDNESDKLILKTNLDIARRQIIEFGLTKVIASYPDIERSGDVEFATTWLTPLSLLTDTKSENKILEQRKNMFVLRSYYKSAEQTYEQNKDISVDIHSNIKSETELLATYQTAIQELFEKKLEIDNLFGKVGIVDENRENEINGYINKINDWIKDLKEKAAPYEQAHSILHTLLISEEYKKALELIKINRKKRIKTTTWRSDEVRNRNDNNGEIIFNDEVIKEQDTDIAEQIIKSRYQEFSACKYAYYLLLADKDFSSTGPPYKKNPQEIQETLLKNREAKGLIDIEELKEKDESITKRWKETISSLDHAIQIVNRISEKIVELKKPSDIDENPILKYSEALGYKKVVENNVPYLLNEIKQAINIKLNESKSYLERQINKIKLSFEHAEPQNILDDCTRIKKSLYRTDSDHPSSVLEGLDEYPDRFLLFETLAVAVKDFINDYNQIEKIDKSSDWINRAKKIEKNITDQGAKKPKKLIVIINKLTAAQSPLENTKSIHEKIQQLIDDHKDNIDQIRIYTINEYSNELKSIFEVLKKNSQMPGMANSLTVVEKDIKFLDQAKIYLDASNNIQRMQKGFAIDLRKVLVDLEQLIKDEDSLFREKGKALIRQNDLSEIQSNDSKIQIFLDSLTNQLGSITGASTHDYNTLQSLIDSSQAIETYITLKSTKTPDLSKVDDLFTSKIRQNLNPILNNFIDNINALEFQQAKKYIDWYKKKYPEDALSASYSEALTEANGLLLANEKKWEAAYRKFEECSTRPSAKGHALACLKLWAIESAHKGYYYPLRHQALVNEELKRDTDLKTIDFNVRLIEANKNFVSRIMSDEISSTKHVTLLREIRNFTGLQDDSESKLETNSQPEIAHNSIVEFLQIWNKYYQSYLTEPITQNPLLSCNLSELHAETEMLLSKVEELIALFSIVNKKAGLKEIYNGMIRVEKLLPEYPSTTPNQSAGRSSQNDDFFSKSWIWYKDQLITALQQSETQQAPIEEQASRSESDLKIWLIDPQQINNALAAQIASTYLNIELKPRYTNLTDPKSYISEIGHEYESATTHVNKLSGLFEKIDQFFFVIFTKKDHIQETEIQSIFNAIAGEADTLRSNVKSSLSSLKLIEEFVNVLSSKIRIARTLTCEDNSNEGMNSINDEHSNLKNRLNSTPYKMHPAIEWAGTEIREATTLRQKLLAATDALASIPRCDADITYPLQDKEGVIQELSVIIEENNPLNYMTLFEKYRIGREEPNCICLARELYNYLIQNDKDNITLWKDYLLTQLNKKWFKNDIDLVDELDTHINTEITKINTLVDKLRSLAGNTISLPPDYYEKRNQAKFLESCKEFYSWVGLKFTCNDVNDDTITTIQTQSESHNTFIDCCKKFDYTTMIHLTDADSFVKFLNQDNPDLLENSLLSHLAKFLLLGCKQGQDEPLYQIGFPALKPQQHSSKWRRMLFEDLKLQQRNMINNTLSSIRTEYSKKEANGNRNVTLADTAPIGLKPHEEKWNDAWIEALRAIEFWSISKPGFLDRMFRKSAARQAENINNIFQALKKAHDLCPEYQELKTQINLFNFGIDKEIEKAQ